MNRISQTAWFEDDLNVEESISSLHRLGMEIVRMYEERTEPIYGTPLPAAMPIKWIDFYSLQLFDKEGTPWQLPDWSELLDDHTAAAETGPDSETAPQSPSEPSRAPRAHINPPYQFRKKRRGARPSNSHARSSAGSQGSPDAANLESRGTTSGSHGDHDTTVVVQEPHTEVHEGETREQALAALSDLRQVSKSISLTVDQLIEEMTSEPEQLMNHVDREWWESAEWQSLDLSKVESVEERQRVYNDYLKREAKLESDYHKYARLEAESREKAKKLAAQTMTVLSDAQEYQRLRNVTAESTYNARAGQVKIRTEERKLAVKTYEIIRQQKSQKIESLAQQFRIAEYEELIRQAELEEEAGLKNTAAQLRVFGMTPESAEPAQHAAPDYQQIS